MWVKKRKQNKQKHDSCYQHAGSYLCAGVSVLSYYYHHHLYLSLNFRPFYICACPGSWTMHRKPYSRAKLIILAISVWSKTACTNKKHRPNRTASRSLSCSHRYDLSLSLSLCILKMSHEFALFLRHDIFVTLILSLVVMLYAIWVQTRCVLPPDSLRIQLSSIGRGLEYCSGEIFSELISSLLHCFLNIQLYIRFYG